MRISIRRVALIERKVASYRPDNCKSYADLPKATQNLVCAKQPTLLRPFAARLAPVSPSAHGEAGFVRHDRGRPISDRPPSLKPLDLGEPSLLGRIPFTVGPKNTDIDIKRRTIGQPTAFRRLELTEEQRRSLIPLQLEPRTLRDSVVLSSNDNTIEHLSIGTDLPIESQTGSALSDAQPRPQSLTPPPPTLLYGDSHRVSQLIRERHTKRPALSSYSSSSSMRSMRRQALESHSSSSASSSPHQSIDWSKLHRRRSSSRKPSTESLDSGVEQEIIELNTIVEEKRSESSRSISSDGHVSAVAPLMSIRARSETLNDIGSAFSRPKPCHSNSDSGSEMRSEPEARAMSAMEKRLSRPFTAMPDLSMISEPSDTRSSKIGWSSAHSPRLF